MVTLCRELSISTSAIVSPQSNITNRWCRECRLDAPQGLQYLAPRAAGAEIIILDPLYSTHDQDEADTRAMAALCQSCYDCASFTPALIVPPAVSALRTPRQSLILFEGSLLRLG